jgi:hypothetical protein
MRPSSSYSIPATAPADPGEPDEFHGAGGRRHERGDFPVESVITSSLRAICIESQIQNASVVHVGYTGVIAVSLTRLSDRQAALLARSPQILLSRVP